MAHGDSRSDAPADAPADAQGDRAPAPGHVDGGLLRATPEQGTWAADELQRALARVEALTRELQQVETTVRVQQDEVSRLQDALQVVEGRTVRHEAGQEQAREVRQEIAELEERLVQETSLRRDLSAQLARVRNRDAETEQEIHRALQVVLSRLDDIDGRTSAETLRQRRAAEEIAEVEHDGEGLEARLDAVERRVAAEFEANRHLGTEIARIASGVSQLMSAVDALEARSRAILTDQRRLDDDIAAFRSIRDREDELREVMEQHRATRARLEDRMAQVEESIEEVRRELAASSEEHALMLRRVSGADEQRRDLLERLGAQRDNFMEHLRRQVRAEEESHRRAIEEREREIRVARALLVKLTEETDEAEQEQPL